MSIQLGISAFCETNQIPFQTDVDCKQLTSFSTGGTAKLLIKPQNLTHLSALLSFLAQKQSNFFLLGKGSNLLAPDGEVSLPLIRLEGEFQEISLLEGNQIRCGAGCSLAQLCKFALAHHLSGLEFAYGIPGTAGGAVFMNAGAYGGEMKDVVLSVEHLDPLGNPGKFSLEELAFDYRESVYQSSPLVITSLTLQLTPGDPKEIEGKMQELLARRKDKQPLDLPSAGSTFRRPPGHFAGALIEGCGLKGFQLGGACVSQKHAGFLVNQDHATTQDVLDLIDYVKRTVKEQTGVQLECEVRQIPSR